MGRYAFGITGFMRRFDVCHYDTFTPLHIYYGTIRLLLAVFLFIVETKFSTQTVRAGRHDPDMREETFTEI